MAKSEGDHLATLRKILEHESRLGFQDSAVAGGLEPFVSRWLAGSSAARLVQLLAGYNMLSVAERKQRVVAALRELGGTITVQPIGAIGGPPPSRSVGATGGRPPSQSVATGGRPPSQPVPATSEPTPSQSVGTTGGRPPSSPSLSATPRRDKNRSAPPASELDAPVTRLRGVSAGYARRLDRLGIRSLHDLLYHFPRRHVDYRNMRPIKDLAVGATESVLATIWEVRARRTRSGLAMIELLAGDETGTVGAVWFNQPHLVKSLPQNRQVVLSGRVEIGSHGQPVFKSPDWELLGADDLTHAGRLVPVYPLTEGIGGRWLRRLIKNALDRYLSELVDHLPLWLRREEDFLGLADAVAQLHFPDNETMLRRATERLAFDELFRIQVGVLRRRREWRESQPGHAFHVDLSLVEAFHAALPFQLTRGQERAAADILSDMAEATPMTRLLQGDVGSGKTVIAALAIVVAAANGYQSVLMAPTEILAEQHHRTLCALLPRILWPPASPRTEPLRVRLLTGSLPKREREAAYSAAADGSVDVLVGTQALIQQGLALKQLGLAVIDEQHRFGVAQRAVLRQKGFNPDLLVMTATPIPRTLALTLYGDLDLSTIGELPPGRQKVKTLILGPNRRSVAYDFLRRRVAAGEQAFVICPLVEESERIEAKAATAEHQRLQSEIFPDLRLGLLHGRMAGRDKEATMQAFRTGEYNVLVSTAVVEVGIDVPNATIMLVEGADRFGLAQLHQFRGRVGRGTAESYCILISDSPSDEAEERLQIMVRTHDGCALAEEDLRLRGPGEFFGTRQSGLPDLKVARLGDVTLLERAREAARRLLGRDPELAASEHRLLAAQVAAFWQGGADIS